MSDRMTSPESLPPLPDADVLIEDGRDEYGYVTYAHAHSDDQMRAYAAEAVSAALSARQVQPEHPMACWSVDVHDDDDGRTWINIRNPDDDVVCLSVKTMVRRGQRSIAASVLYEFHAAWQAMHCQPAQAAQAALDAVRVAVRVAVLAEREACALASERQIDRWVDDRARYAASECAAAIRACTDAAMLSASPESQKGGAA